MGMNLEPPEDWREIKRIAPYFCESLELLSKVSFSSPDPLDLPECLGLRPRSEFSDLEWCDYLDQTDVNGLSNRELYLRVLLAYAVSDQGSHILGVRHFMRSFIQSSYDSGFRFFHEKEHIDGLHLVDLALEAADEAKNKYSEGWARERKKTANAYNVFTVDGRGAFSANSYVNSRIAPVLYLPHLLEGGMESKLGSVKQQSQVNGLIMKDERHGLKDTIGDKALDLYIKWVFFTFNLFIHKKISYPLERVFTPMDQRIGRVLMRCGFMDEFFGVKWCFENQNDRLSMFSENGKTATLEKGIPPNTKVHLRVTNFRRDGKVNDEELKEIFGRIKAPIFSRNRRFGPQITLSLILQEFSKSKGVSYYPGDLDDALMSIATGCTDSEPKCENCVISTTCQANNGSEYLKKYHT